MSNSYEKSVKGGTKVKLAPPKSKYVEHILTATRSGDAGVADVFRTLTHRLRDSTWTVAFKALIIVHLMIKEGAPDVTLRYLSVAPRNRLAVNSFTDVQTQGHNIRRYAEYLLSRADAFGKSSCDYVRLGGGRMRQSTVEKGLLRETESIQRQVSGLVRCDLLSDETENEISLTAFRLLTRDLLDLYNAENEAVMNVLSRYFEMSRPDAERAIEIYRTFCEQTEQVVKFLSMARKYEHATRLEIPKLKHAPTSLAASLQEYLDDKDFEVNRRQYLAEQEAKRSGKPIPKAAKPPATPPSNAPMATTSAAQSTPRATASQAPKGPAPNLIDFFDSIEDNQQMMATNPFLQQQQQQQQQQVQGMQYQIPPQNFQPMFQQPTNGFSNGMSTNPQIQPQQAQPYPLQTQFTGPGFGGYGTPPPQQPFATGNMYSQSPQAYTPVQTQSPGPMQNPTQIPSQTSNPFRQSMMPTGSGSAFSPPPPEKKSSNPFARSAAPASIPEQPQMPFQHTTPFTSPPPPAPIPQLIQAQSTGTNPFARNTTPLSQQQPQQPTPPMSPPNALQVQPTGSTNPFRQSAFVNQQTGQGWQHTPQATMGGLESLDTIPIFPRPGQQPTMGSSQNPSPWG